MPDKFGLIAGSGFQELTDGVPGEKVATRFGEPSSRLKTISIAGVDVVTLARHGEPHTIPPHAINYRANLAALQEAGATHVIALCTVGAVTEKCDCGDIAIPDEVLDYTWGRGHSIYDGKDPQFEHIEFDEPFSRSLRKGLLDAAEQAGVACFDGGVYAAMQGPRLETAAEVRRIERDGADYVGMTAMPEASLAREMGVHYACLALTVNYAAGRGSGPIHADIAQNSSSARHKATALLQQFFSDKVNR